MISNKTYAAADLLHKKSVSLSAQTGYSTAEVPRFIYVTGCDGTGKSTQVNRLIERLTAAGKEPIHLWLRFPFLFSLPLLAYARWAGFSRSEQIDGTTYGYWHFDRSWLLRTLLPWILLFDTALFGLWKVHLPLLLWRMTHPKRVIVCERFALDTLVDLAVGLNAVDGAHSLFRQPIGKLFCQLLPRDISVTFLDLDAQTARARRPDLIHDQRLEMRLQAFRTLADELEDGEFEFKVLSSLTPIADLNHEILSNVLLCCDAG